MYASISASSATASILRAPSRSSSSRSSASSARACSSAITLNMSRRSFLAGVARRRLSVWSRWKVRRVLMPGAHPQFSTISRTSYRMAAEERKPAPRTPGRVGWVAVSEHQQRNAPGMPWAEVIHPGIPVGQHPLNPSHGGPCVYLGPLLKGHGAGLALEAAHRAGRPIVLAGTQPSPRATAYTELELWPQLASDDELLESMSSLEQWELLASASCLVAPLHPGVAYSLEVVEAMAYGTPVVTMVGTVGAELVSHGVSGLVLSDRVLLPGAISKAERLDPRRVRAHAASRFDLRGMVSAYEWLLTQFAAIPAADGGGGLAATPSDAPAGSAPVPTVWDS